MLAAEAREGRITAGPLPVVEGWALENRFEPLAPFGIAVAEESRSVFVFSKKPLRDIADGRIGVTQESSSSVALLDVLGAFRYGRPLRIERGFSETDVARLVIGDAALRYGITPPSGEWPHVTDLATEWWSWQRLPFVFAQWVVSRALPREEKERLAETVAQSLDKGLADVDAIAATFSPRLDLPEKALAGYLNNFRYKLGAQEMASIERFRDFAERRRGAAEIAQEVHAQ